MAAGTGTEEPVFLKLVVHTEKNLVLFAEAGKDLVDVLLSFLSLPLGTIARLVGKESNLPPARVGSLSSLYESVANLDNKHFWTDTCKEMLLQPRNSMASYCQNLRLNIDDTEPTKYFICENWDCSRRESGGLLSTFKNKRCSCGGMLNREICLDKSLISGQIKEGFVRETASFIISDDLKIMPLNFRASFNLIQNLGNGDMDLVEEMTVNVTQKEVLDLLKCSLVSKRALTDVFLQKPKSLKNSFESVFPSDYRIGEEQANNGRHMKLKITYRKSNSKVLFAEAEEDFADFLLSFLTFPLGGVEKMLGGNASGGSFGNIYQSFADLHGSRHLKSEELKKMLINPKIASQYKLTNQILPVDEVLYTSSYTCHSWYVSGEGFRAYLIAKQEYSAYRYEVYAPVTLLDPNSSTGNETTVPFGFAKGPMYMVTDDLVVTPISFVSATPLLRTSKIPFDDLEEMVLSIGVKEGLSILKASLVSTSTLTTGLSQFMKPNKEEN